MKKIKIAQIGVGHDHAGNTMGTLKNMSDVFDIVGYAIVPEDSLNLAPYSYEGQKYFYDGIPQMTVDEILNYEGLEAVCIETEDRALTKYALMAAEKGLHVQMDKPGGVSDEDFDRLIDTMEKTGKVFSAGYMYRYNTAVLKLKEDIANGKLGDIISVEAQMNCSHPADKRTWLGNYPSGMLYFLGCHLVDLVFGIMGEPDEVIPLSTSSGVSGVETDDFGMAVFKYPHGVSFVKTSAVEIGGFERRQLVVSGTKGTIELKPLEWIAPKREGMVSAQFTGVREAFKGGWHERGDRYETEVADRYIPMFTAFAEYVRGEKTNPYTYEYERALHKLILKACTK